MVRRGGDLLLVRQRESDGQTPHWSLPGGPTPAGETLLEALTNFVLEQTGLTIDAPGRPVYIARIDGSNGITSQTGEPAESTDEATVFVFEVTNFHGDLRAGEPDDPGFGLGFFNRTDAIELLERLPRRVAREPIVAALKGEAAAGSVWMYRQEDGGEALLGRIPSAISGNTPTFAPEPQVDARTQRESGLMMLGCLAIVLLFVVVIIVGIIAVSHPHF